MCLGTGCSLFLGTRGQLGGSYSVQRAVTVVVIVVVVVAKVSSSGSSS